MEQPGSQAATVTDANRVVYEAAMRETRVTLRRWRRGRFVAVLPWMAVSLGVAAFMLIAVLAIGSLVHGDPFVHVPNVNEPGTFGDVARVVRRNVLVLALHAFICIAAFMAMRTLPAQAKLRTGVDRWVHHHAGRIAMVVVGCATVFSISTQIYALSHDLADYAAALHVGVGSLLLTALPHAVLELTAVFLPLGALAVLARRKRWEQLLAAAALTVSIALPMILVAATIEAYLWPVLLRGLVG